MFEKIVLAIDGSDQGRGAIAAAIDLANKSRGEVLIVHVHDAGHASRETVDLESESDTRLLIDALEEVTRTGVSARSELRAAQSADVAKEILHAAKGFGADTIVLGSRGLGDFAGLLLGSVAHRVIQQADCPVVVVRAAGTTAPAPNRREGRTVAA